MRGLPVIHGGLGHAAPLRLGSRRRFGAATQTGTAARCPPRPPCPSDTGWLPAYSERSPTDFTSMFTIRLFRMSDRFRPSYLAPSLIALKMLSVVFKRAGGSPLGGVAPPAEGLRKQRGAGILLEDRHGRRSPPPPIILLACLLPLLAACLACCTASLLASHMCLPSEGPWQTRIARSLAAAQAAKTAHLPTRGNSR